MYDKLYHSDGVVLRKLLQGAALSPISIRKLTFPVLK